MVLVTVGCTPPGPRTPSTDVEPMRRVIEHNGARLSYLVHGDARGTRVILVHGTPGEALGWSDYLANPPAGVEVVSLDRPGFGQSGPDGPVTSLARQADAVAALLPTDGRAAVLVGHSLGGPIVAWVAAQHPKRVTALVLLAASLDPALESIHPMQHVGQWAWVSRWLPRAIRNANEELMVLRPELDALQVLLPRVTAPTLIVHGTADSLVPVENVAFIEKHLSSATCLRRQLLPNVNHFLPWNSQAVVRDGILWALNPSC